MKNIQSDPITIRSILERWVQTRKCFVLIHDGSKSPYGKRAFFTREYALIFKGKLTPYCIKFVYDYRSGLGDVTIDDVSRRVISELNKTLENHNGNDNGRLSIKEGFQLIIGMKLHSKDSVRTEDDVIECVLNRK